MKNRKNKNRLPPFLPLHNETLDAPATKALSHGAFRLYATLKREFNSSASDRRNGRIYLSLREAQEKIGSNREEIARWYRELQHYGFIVMATPGCLGVEGKGKSPHWRLTELPCLGEPATKNFLRWNGDKFRDQKKQKPGPEKAATLDRKRQPVVDRKRQPPDPESGPEKAAIRNAVSGPEKAAILSLPSTGPRSREPDAPEATVHRRGKASADSQGTTTVYGADGRKAGSITTNRSR
jgi:hypothetical protein